MKLPQAFLFASLVALFLPTCAFANPIIGTIGLNVVGSITPSAGSLNTSINLTSVETSSSTSGDWNAFGSGIPVAAFLQFGAFSTVGNAFGFSDAGFGTFAGMVQIDTGEFGTPQIALRQVSVVGLFTPGTTLAGQGFTTSSLAQLDFLIQSINGGARSASLLFGTTSVPEPGTLALTFFGLSAFAVRNRWKAGKFRNAK